MMSNCANIGRTPYYKCTGTLLLLISHVLFILVIITSSSNCAKSDSSMNSSNKASIRQQLILYSVKSNNTNTTSNIAKIQNENYRANTRNLERVSRMIHANKLKSACVQAGLWAIFYKENYQNVAAVLYASSNSQDQTCTQNQLNETDFSQYKSIRYIGNSDILASGLSLYSGPFFSQDELYFNGQLLSLPAAQVFHSYGFTGNDSWTLHQHTNFSGQATCLMASGGNVADVITNTFDRIVYNKNKGVELLIGSVEKGCTDKSNRTLIFPSGETIVQWTNKPIGKEDSAENIQHKPASLTLISELDGNVLTTDATELRLPQKYTFNRYILSSTAPDNESAAADVSWTIFSGTEFTGKSKCFHSIHDSNNVTTTESDLEFQVPFRQELYLVGSIRKGCFESNTTEPVLELHTSISEEDADDEADQDNLFFISFIIGLSLLLIIILLSIIIILYFYLKARSRRRKHNRAIRALNS